MQIKGSISYCFLSLTIYFQASCLLISKLFDSFSHGSGSISHNPLLNNIADKNGDQEVSFDEFKEKLESYLKILLATQDANHDGMVDKVGTPLINLELFLTLTNTTFEIFDKNGDDIIFDPDSGGNQIKLSHLAI